MAQRAPDGTSGGLLAGVRDFLAGLRRDLPALFGEPPAPPRSPRRARSQDPVRDYFHERVRHWSGVMEIVPNKVFLKNQRTRWGSCSVKGNLNFNRALAKAPAEIVDYVVIHELAHLREMNHSPRFWGIVDRWCPEQKAHRRWLRQNAGLLFGKETTARRAGWRRAAGWAAGPAHP